MNVLRCGSGERIACTIKKGVLYIVEIFSDHDEYERRMPLLSEEQVKPETFTPCDFTSEDLGTDDTDIEGVCEERNRLQISIKELQNVIISLRSENKDSAAIIELQNEELLSLQEKLKEQAGSIAVLKESNAELQSTLSSLQLIITDLQEKRKKQESFMYRLTHLFVRQG